MLSSIPRHMLSSSGSSISSHTLSTTNQAATTQDLPLPVISSNPTPNNNNNVFDFTVGVEVDDELIGIKSDEGVAMTEAEAETEGGVETEEARRDKQLMKSHIVRDYDSMEEVDQVEDITVELLPYQKQGIAWMIQQEKQYPKSGILADEMGLGKTIQTLGLMAKNRSANPERKSTLVICPTTTMFQWKEEIETKLKPNTFRLMKYYGPGKSKKAKKIKE
jgi:SNF2 family DNA or RNA helicase